EDLPKKDITDDIQGLERSWSKIRQRAGEVKAPALLYSDLDVVLRCVRDMLSDDVDQIVLDSRDDYERTKAFVSQFMSSLTSRIALYEDLEPVFDRYGVEDQISRATEPKVWLKSGGYL